MIDSQEDAELNKELLNKEARLNNKELPTEADMMAAAEIDSWRLERDSWRTLAKRQRRTIIKWENWENQQRHDCKLEREKTRKRFEEVFGPLLQE